MADAIQSRAELITALANNNTGAITPQVLRNLVISLHGVYGELRYDSGPNSQNINVTPVKLEALNVAGEGAGIDLLAINAELSPVKAGVFEVKCQLSFTATALGAYRIQLYKNTVAVDGAASRSTITEADEHRSVAFSRILSCNVSDALAVYVSAPGASSFTVSDGQFSMRRIA